MNQLNSLILEGNLTKDAVITEPAAGFKVCKLCLAVNRFYKNKKDQGVEEVSFFDVEAYGKLAEYCMKNSTKGRGIRVVGRLKQESWKDNEGKYCSRIYVIAEHIEYKPVFNKTNVPEDTAKVETPVVEYPMKEEQKVEEAVAF